MPILVAWHANEDDLSFCGRPLKQKEAKMAPEGPRGVKLPKWAFCISKTRAGSEKNDRNSNLANSGLASGMSQNEAEQAKTAETSKLALFGSAPLK